MIVLEPTNNSQTLRFIPQRSYTSNFLSEGYPYTIIFINEETGALKSLTQPVEWTYVHGVVQWSAELGFTSADNEQFYMMYVFSRPISGTIDASNYTSHWSYCVYSSKILVSSLGYDPVRYSVNGSYSPAADAYTEYPYQQADNDFVIL